MTPAPALPDAPEAGAPPAARAVIVTGGSRGLGFEMADALVAAGHRVLITGAREGVELEQAAERLNAGAADPRALAMQADVARWNDCQAVATRCMQAWGRIDGLVNNAGRGMLEISDDFNRRPALFWQADPQGFRNIVDANVTGAFQMARACVPAMVAQGFGRVVNVSTSLQTMVRTGYCPYGPSKAALEAMSVIWAKDLQGTGVTVNVLLPGGASDTRLLPAGTGQRSGADGLLLSPSLMRAPIVWLMAHAGAEINGERYIARLWPAGQPWESAAAAARDEQHELPVIM
jgi:NAD(P)-dependent dehydrogenase (short-subunit alcohol dehydrogenase family)